MGESRADLGRRRPCDGECVILPVGGPHSVTHVHLLLLLFGFGGIETGSHYIDHAGLELMFIYFSQPYGADAVFVTTLQIRTLRLQEITYVYISQLAKLGFTSRKHDPQSIVSKAGGVVIPHSYEVPL